MSSTKIEAERTVERALVLFDSCVGLMVRISRLAKTLRSQERCFKALKNPEWKGIRAKLTKSFPEMADMTRDPKYDAFQKSAASILSELRHAYELFVDIAEHVSYHLQLLRSMLSAQGGFDADLGRDTFQTFCASFCAYCRLHFLLAMMDERRLVCALYAAAHSCARSSNEPRFARLAQLVARHFEEPVRSLTEQFKDFAAPMASVLTQSLTTLQLGASGAAELLRRSALMLNEDTDVLGSPVLTPLNARNKMGPALHAELLLVRDTCDFCVFATLACPAVLAESPTALSVCHAACCDSLVVGVFRGASLNIHTELEALGKWYPPRGGVKNWPRDLRLAKLFKDWSKEAVQQCGLKHRERRAYLAGEIEVIGGLVAACPTLSAPNAPLCIAAVSLALDETIWLLRHLPTNPSALPPKTRLKHYNSEHFDDPKLAVFAGAACRLGERLRRCQPAIGEYYIDFLRGADTVALGELATRVASSLPAKLQGVVSSFASRLAELGAQDALTAAHCVSRDGVFIGGDFSAEATKASKLATLRLDWRRVVSVLATSSVAKNDSVAELLRRGNLALLDRTRLADGSALSFSCDFGRIWPFRQHLVKAFDDALQKSGAWTAHALRLLLVVSRDALRASTHPASTEDAHELAVEARRFGEQAAADRCGAAIRACMTQLASLCSSLAEQVAPVQAAYRLERREQAQRDAEKRGNERPADEPVAGYESAADNARLVEPIAVAESRLASLLAACRDDDFGTVIIHDTIFRPSEFARSAVLVYMQQQIPACFFDSSGKTLHRPTAVERSLAGALSAAERAATYVQVDYAGYLASLLMDPARSEEPTTKLDLDEDGAPVPPKLLSRGHSPIAEQAASFYVRLVRRLPHGVVYCPSRSGFKTIPHAGVQPNADDSAVDKYLSSHELEAYVRVVGADGARCLDKALTAAAVDEMAKVKRYVCFKDNTLRQHLERVKDGILSGEWAPAALELRAAGALDDLLRAATRLGNVLELRRLVREHAYRAAQRAAPHLAATARLALDAAKISANKSSLIATPSWLLAAADAEFIERRDPTFAENGDFDCPPYERDGTLYEEAKALLETPDEWRLLPYAFAAALVANDWKSARWIPDLQALDNGAHASSAALKALAHCFNGLPPDAPGAAQEAKAVVARFIEAAAACLKWMRLHEKDFADLPVRAMAAYIELVATDAAIPRSFLEKHLPYAVIHASLMDIAMGHQSADDEKKTPFDVKAFDFARDN